MAASASEFFGLELLGTGGGDYSGGAHTSMNTPDEHDNDNNTDVGSTQNPGNLGPPTGGGSNQNGFNQNDPYVQAALSYGIPLEQLQGFIRGNPTDYSRIPSAFGFQMNGPAGGGGDPNQGQNGPTGPPGWQYPTLPPYPGTGGNVIPPDLLNLRNVLSTILAQQVWDKQGYQNAYEGPLGVNAEQFLGEGLQKYREINDNLRGLQNNTGDLRQRISDTATGRSEIVPDAVRGTLSDLMRTGGAPDITNALAAIRSQGLSDIDRFRADERERFGAMGLSSGSDVAESVGRGTSQGVSDILSRQESLIANILSQANATKLGAAQTYGAIRSNEFGSLQGALQALNQNMTSYSGSQLGAVGGIADRGSQVMAVTERNNANQYSEFLRTNPDLLSSAISYATGYPPIKPVVQGSGVGTGSALAAAGIGAAGASAATWLPLLLGAFSDRTMKEDIQELDAGEVARALIDLPISRWRYKGDKTVHLGPMAQDFQERFGIGDGKTIQLVDVMGVALATNKALAEKYIGRGKSKGAARA